MEHKGIEISCPFCNFSNVCSDSLIQHVEIYHCEDGCSPFTVIQDAIDTGLRVEDQHQPGPRSSVDRDDLNDGYINCPQECGELIMAAELPTHLDLHIAERIALEEVCSATNADDSHESFKSGDDWQSTYDRVSMNSPKALRKRDEVLHARNSGNGRKRDARAGENGVTIGLKAGRQRAKKAKRGSSNVAGCNSVRRLGRAELGPHAHEKQMPPNIRKVLEEGPRVTSFNRIQPDGTLLKVEVVANETPEVIPVLCRLCEQDESVERVFFCHPSVRHVFKLPGEGGFCGYRNIQMMVSCIQNSRADGHEKFPGRLPSILMLQEMIEQAWDMDINSTGRIETGGIKGTRKYIGTSEAQALFLSLGIECELNAFVGTEDVPAHDFLRMAVVEYFHLGSPVNSEEKIIQTKLPPIYLQHRGHSLTVIGFEIRKNGTANLLVFDPVFKTSQAIKRLVDKRINWPNPTRIIKAYRRGTGYLQNYREFEILKLSPSKYIFGD